MFFWTVAIRKHHRLTGRGGRRLPFQDKTPVGKSYVTRKLLSTENALELPKCSKSLHFREFARPGSGFSKNEEKAKLRG